MLSRGTPYERRTDMNFQKVRVLDKAAHIGQIYTTRSVEDGHKGLYGTMWNDFSRPQLKGRDGYVTYGWEKGSSAPTAGRDAIV
jgi:hypothetical protein